jgi:hypothetical protein
VFVVLLLVGAGMASVPGGDDPTRTIREFYTAHTGVIAVAQVFGVLAAAAFVLFARRMRRAGGEADGGALERTGVGVGGAAFLTAVPVIWLIVVADDGGDRLVHRLAVASDLTDVVLFAAIATWLVMVVRAAEPLWFKALAGVVAVLALGRALLLLVGSQALELVAPLAFLLVVAVLSSLLILRRSPIRRH